MSLIDKPKVKVRLVAYLILLTVLYALCVLSDYFLAKRIADSVNTNTIANVEALDIEEKRRVNEDVALISSAKLEGYKSLLYPDLFDNHLWKDLAEKYSVAPLAPQPLQKLYYCNEGYGQVRYQSDRFGFRNKDALWDSPKVDVILIGDSFVQGACVEEQESISGHLTSLGMISLNLGTGSNSPIHYASIVKVFTNIIETKNLVIVFYPNDNINDSISIYKKYYIDNLQSYFEKNADNRPKTISKKLTMLYKDAETLAKKVLTKDPETEKKVADWIYKDKIKAHFALATITKMVFEVWTARKLPYSSKLAIDLAISTCKKNNCQPIVVYIPNSHFWRPDQKAKSYLELLKKYALNQSQIKLIDMTDDIEKHGSQAYAKAGPHLSPLGYKLVADKIYYELNLTGGH